MVRLSRLKLGFHVTFFTPFFSPSKNGLNEFVWYGSHMTLKYVTYTYCGSQETIPCSVAGNGHGKVNAHIIIFVGYMITWRTRQE